MEGVNGWSGSEWREDEEKSEEDDEEKGIKTKGQQLCVLLPPIAPHLSPSLSPPSLSLFLPLLLLQHPPNHAIAWLGGWRGRAKMLSGVLH